MRRTTNGNLFLKPSPQSIEHDHGSISDTFLHYLEDLRSGDYQAAQEKLNILYREPGEQ